MRYLYSLQSLGQSLSRRGLYLVSFGVVAVGGIAVIMQYPGIWWIVLLGITVIALLLLLFRLMLTIRDRKRGKETNAKVLSGSQGSAGVTDAQDQAALDDLQKKFTNGVETLDSLGLDLYALPWFVIVGQPASGKTEAIRRCRIPFPPGLTDELQGTGGTVNMDWWFTNDAVILDTAGKMLFQEAGQGTSPEWVKFLKLVREARPHCPINGMLLVIPADSLISDSPEQIDQNAKTIATQLNLIQRTLGVRFPVFVLITKCDLVTGFREFFDSLDDRRHQQMLGWSNPDSLDTPFDPSKIEAHLALVRQRLEQRRFDLLQDPVSTGGKSQRRLDEVDRLFDFPAAMEDLSDKLQSYLEIIFTGSKLAPKPLFLRGIYFTSSIQKGSILDGVLAEAMGVPLESLTETRPFERVRPLFLRDLFMEKIFPEGGLVTRADNTVKLKSRRRVLVLGTAAVGTIVLIAFTWLGFRTFQKSIGDQGEVWTGIASTIESNTPPSLLMEPNPGMADYLYNGDHDPVKRGGDRAMDELSSVTQALAEQRIKVPFIFRLTSGLDGDLLRDQRQDAHRNLLGLWMMRPVVGATSDRLAKTTDYNNTEAITALAQLIRLRTLLAGQTPAGPPATLRDQDEGSRDSAANLHALLHFNISDENLENLTQREAQIQQLQQVIDATLTQPEDKQIFARQALESQVSDEQLNHFLSRYLEAVAQTQETSQNSSVAQLSQLVAGLNALEEAQLQLHSIDTVFVANQTQEMQDHWATWSIGEQGFVTRTQAVTTLIRALEAKGYDLNQDIGALFQRAVKEELDLTRERMAVIRDQLPAPQTAPPLEDSAGAIATPGTAPQDAEFKRLQDSIGQWLKSYEAGLNAQTLAEQDDFAELKNRFITPTATMRLSSSSEIKYPCVHLSAMYRNTAHFRVAALDSLALSDLADAIDAVAVLQADVEQTLAFGSRHLGSSDAQEHCDIILNLESKSARSARLALATSQDIDPARIGQQVQRLATPQDDEDHWLQPNIRMSVGFDRQTDVNGYYLQRYHPQGLRAYLGGLGRLLNLAQSEDFDTLFAHPQEDRRALERTGAQLEQYLIEYAQYWTQTVVQAAEYKQAEDWPAFVEAARGVDAQAVQNGLGRLAEQIEEAFAVIPQGLLAPDRYAAFENRVDAVDNALTVSSAERDNLISAANDLLGHWLDIDDLNTEVKRIREMRPNRFLREYLKDLYPDDEADAPVAFWKDFAYNPLALVAQAGAREIEQARARLTDPQGLMRFPLFNRADREEGDVFSPEDLVQAHETIRTLTALSSTDRNTANSIGTGNDIAGYDKINQLLEQMRGGEQASEEALARLDRLMRIVDALTHPRGLEVEVWIPGESFLEDKTHLPPWAEDMVPANYHFTHVNVPGKPQPMETSRDENREAFTLSLTSDDTFELGFILYESGSGDATTPVPYTLSGQWSVLDAILPSGDENHVYIDDAGIYWVPIGITDPNGNRTRYYWIGYQFNREDLPTPTEWPKD